MEYQVPQFIEVEDKIFGPLSFKQFIYVAGGAGLCAIILLSLPLLFGVLLALPVAAFTGALAFYKVNNKSFIEMLEAGLTYYTGGRLYLWKKEDKPLKKYAEPKEFEGAAVITREKLGLSKGKLEELAWSLDVKDQRPS
jgi:hypothetical protein